MSSLKIGLNIYVISCLVVCSSSLSLGVRHSIYRDVIQAMNSRLPSSMRRFLSRHWRTDQAPVNETSCAKVGARSYAQPQHERCAKRVAEQRHTGKKRAAGDAEPQCCKQAGEAPWRSIAREPSGAEQLPKSQIVGQIKGLCTTNGTDHSERHQRPQH